MSDDRPRTYGREYERPLPGPLRIRVGRYLDRREVTRFVVQLEYAHDGGWHEVVRYDHDGQGSEAATHKVTEEGLHIDIYHEATEWAEHRLKPLSGYPYYKLRAGDYRAIITWDRNAGVIRSEGGGGR
jgi:hypothetical protein